MKNNFKLKTQSLKLKTIKGFTLIELLMVLSIMAILTGVLFASQYSIREQIFLFQDQYKIMDFINQAKNLTLAAFQRDLNTCGYGVSFDGDSGKIILYKDKKETGDTDCNNHPHEYNEGMDEIFDSFELNKTEKFDFEGSKSVVFNAPSLTTYLTEGADNVSSGEIAIIIKTTESESEAQVFINEFGQVITE